MNARRSAISLSLIVALAAGAATSSLVLAGVAATVAVVAGWVWPTVALELGVLLALTVRPWVDVFSERRAGLGPFVPNPAVLVGLTVLAVAGVHAVRRARSGASFWPSRRLATAHGFLLAAYGVMCFSGVWLSGATGLATGAREAVRMASVIAAFFLVNWWAESSPSRHRRGWSYLFAGASVPIAVALWQYLTGTGYLETAGLNRLQGTLSHPNAFGEYLLPFVLLAVGAVMSTRGSRRLWLLGWAIGLTWLIVQSYSRTVLLVLVAGLVTLPVLRARRFGSRVILQTLAIVGVLVGIGGMLARDALRARFDNLALGRGALDAAMSGTAENSYEWRLVNWGVLISMGLEHPMVGHGAGMTTVLNPIVNTENGVPYNAHNDVVRFFFEGGLLGLAGYLIYAVLVCRWSIRRARDGVLNDGGRSYAVAASWLALLLLSLGNTEISLNTATLYALYGMLALQATAPDSAAEAGGGYPAALRREGIRA